jgi:hypothetical protein
LADGLAGPARFLHDRWVSDLDDLNPHRVIRTAFRTAASLILVASPLAAQTHIKGAATGLSGSFVTMTFDALGIPSNTLLTNQAGSGVTFQDAYYGGSAGFGSSVFGSPAVYNFVELSDQRDSLVIMFSSPVIGAAFNVSTWPGTTLFEAFLGTSKITSFEDMTSETLVASGLYWGFTDFQFDRIVIKSMSIDGRSIGLDNLQFANVSTVPEPSTIAMLGVGLLTTAMFARKRIRRSR